MKYRLLCCCCSQPDVYEPIEIEEKEKMLNNAAAYRKNYEVAKKECRHEAITLLLELLKPAEYYINDSSVLSALRELNVPVMIFIKIGGIFDRLGELFALL